jgi:hypothetical protein
MTEQETPDLPEIPRGHYRVEFVKVPRRLSTLITVANGREHLLDNIWAYAHERLKLDGLQQPFWTGPDAGTIPYRDGQKSVTFTTAPAPYEPVVTRSNAIHRNYELIGTPGARVTRRSWRWIYIIDGREYHPEGDGSRAVADASAVQHLAYLAARVRAMEDQEDQP